MRPTMKGEFPSCPRTEEMNFDRVTGVKMTEEGRRASSKLTKGDMGAASALPATSTLVV